tara:strand:+ start:925 stop:1128 length:204 start_codon:yes stop_codon:yes gene_type:complete
VLEDLIKWFGKYNKEALGAEEEISKALGAEDPQVVLNLLILRRFFVVDRIGSRNFSLDLAVVADAFQ